MDPIEESDGQRLFVEPYGLTKDMTEWCKVDHVVPHLGPPQELAEWFEEHPDGYEFYRARYHDVLAKSPMKPALQQMACVAAQRCLARPREKPAETRSHQGFQAHHIKPFSIRGLA